MLERHACTGFVVQRLTEELDGGEILYRGNIPTQATYTRNLAELIDRGSLYLQKAILDVRAGMAKAEEPLVYDDRLYRTPLLHDSLRYIFKLLWWASKRTLAPKIGWRRRWSVAFAKGDWRKAVLWRGKVLENPKGSFLADPFALVTDAGKFIFVEEYFYDQEKGVISLYEVHANGASSRLGVVLEEEFHLSFPFLFRYNGALYMCLEAAKSGEIRVYRCTSFPMKWELESVLMKDVRASDTMLFEREGRWWMLTSITPMQAGTNPSELFAYHADSPLSQDWVPHPGNPIIMDAASARNAGMLEAEGSLYRVAQSGKFAHYGAKTTIFKIEELTNTSYREVKVQEIQPNFFRNINGTHHLHHDGDLFVYDFSRHEFV